MAVDSTSHTDATFFFLIDFFYLKKDAELNTPPILCSNDLLFFKKLNSVINLKLQRNESR